MLNSAVQVKRQSRIDTHYSTNGDNDQYNYSTIDRNQLLDYAAGNSFLFELEYVGHRSKQEVSRKSRDKSCGTCSYN